VENFQEADCQISCVTTLLCEV